MRRRVATRLVVSVVVAVVALGIVHNRVQPTAYEAHFDKASDTVDRERLAVVARGGRVAPVARTVPRDMLRNYGVLRRARGRADSGVPPAFIARLGGDPRFVRLARVHRGASLLVVPGSKEICVINPTDAGACHLTSWALRGYMLGTTELTDHGAKGGVRVYGLVRDGVRSVTVVMRNGTWVSDDVQNNVFVVDVRGVPAHIEWDERGKLIRRPVPYAE
jgi:hypothetical protein